jgi:hypothetical protein
MNLKKGLERESNGFQSQIGIYSNFQDKIVDNKLYHPPDPENSEKISK